MSTSLSLHTSATALTMNSNSPMVTSRRTAPAAEFFRAVGWDLSSAQPQDWAVDPATLHAAAEARGQRVLGPSLRPGDEMPASHLSRPSR